MKLLLLGPPAAGKGTQAENLVKHYRIPSISTGAIFRKAIEQMTPAGKLAKEYIDKGQLVPDDVTIAIVRERLAEDDCKEGYILDGFPRTLVQAQAADDMGIVFDKVVLIDVADAEVIRRISGRRQCAECGAVYHVDDNPSEKGSFCDKCGAPLVTRDDDTEETVKTRLDVYHSQTEPLVRFYREKGNLVAVTGQQDVAHTTKLLFEAIEG